MIRDLVFPLIRGFRLRLTLPMSLILSVLAIFLSVLLFKRIVEIRIWQLQALLEEQSLQSLEIRNDALIARYKMLSESENLSATGSLLIEEARLQVLIREELKNRSERSQNLRKHYLDPLIQPFVELFTSSETISILQARHPKLMNLLELAYYYETTRDFQKAVATYNIAEDKAATHSRAYYYIYLHRGFCKLVLNKPKEASKDLEILEDSQSPMNFREAARFMRKSIQEEERLALQKNRVVSLREQGVAAFQSMNFLRSLDIFSKMLEYKADSYAYYYRGRSFEELGIRSAAIHDYKQAIRLSKPRRYAVLANRRLFAMGILYTQKKEERQKILKEVMRTARKQGDRLVRTQRLKESLRNIRSARAELPEKPAVEDPIVQEVEKETSQIKIEIPKITPVKSKVQTKRGQQKTILDIETVSNERFSGVMMRETDSEIQLKTKFGVIVIPKKDIIRQRQR